MYITATALPPSPRVHIAHQYVHIHRNQYKQKLDPSRQYPIRTAPRGSLPNTRPGQFFLPGPTSNIFVNPRSQGVLNTYVKMQYECYGGRSAPLYGLKQLNHYKGSGGNKKLLPRRFPTVGIVRKVPSTQTQLSHKHQHHGGDLCPSYGMLTTMDTPNQTRATPSEAVGEECFSLVQYKAMK